MTLQASPAWAADPGPSNALPGQDTATPVLVEGLREPVDAKAAPADAARQHLAANKSRYKIPRAGSDLVPLAASATGSKDETVRLQQKHRGVDVLGGQYVVRMQKQDGKRVVTGTSGHYFTALSTDVTPQVSEEVAVRRAVAATARRLSAALDKSQAPKSEAGDPAATGMTGDAKGLVVLPKGGGVLAYRVTVRGTAPGTGAPVVDEVYVDARSGYPALQYSALKTMTAPAAARTAGEAGEGPGAAGPPATPPNLVPETGSGTRLSGAATSLDIAYDPAAGQYLLADAGRMRATKGLLATWDARGKSVSETSGTWPAGITMFSSPNTAFGAAATDSGAVDAHWNAGQVYDFYKKNLGRDSLDGSGGAVNSLVGVTYYGLPYANAFWDGTKMVYGNGDDEFKPMSADTDVVGHEMTHGVIEHTANLVYAGQSGALNEALADYFGNAIDVTASGTPMNDPAAGLIGENLCRTKAAADCALRDLNDGATTSKSFLGVSFATDNGGVHLNSTIFSGALWDMREDLGGALADKIVYKAVTEYMTPIDGFTEARGAVLAAAKALGATSAQQNTVKRSFNAHGIVPDWEQALGIDTDTLFGKLNTTDSGVGAGGGWWTASKSNDDGSEPYSVYAGRLDGKGAPKVISPNDGRYHTAPATDGKTVVWTAYGPTSVDVLSRPVAGGPIKTLYSSVTGVAGLRVEKNTVVFEEYDILGGRHVGYMRPTDKAPVFTDGRKWNTLTALPSISDNKIAYAKLYPQNGTYRLGVEVVDLATGKAVMTEQLDEPVSLGQTGINGKNVFWLADTDESDGGLMSVVSSGLDGRGSFIVSSERKPGAFIASDLTVSQDALTLVAQTPDTRYRNESLPKLWQLTTDGSRRERVSCNRGEQSYPAAGAGRQVAWLDATTGSTDLVVRERPAGTC
ncbi:peptidase M4 family protein [Streptomyces venezuelae]|uniref:Peptidase M4 family protein n=1 Tax=Streptomyces venezuelae TaxID=54571 RepID=A0A5P2DI68_STRVZ|nr:M4 family metallopeptidase [Streptomyces venezuelae]QES52961.1 peptidase M4 family protein [Streptomyces venezuelae]